MPEPQRPLKVFLSYASQDKPLVRELSRRLVGEGWIETWQDEKSLLPGQDWRMKILDAVDTSDIVIIILSNNSVNKEGYVQKELRYAQEIALEKPEDTIFLIPLRLEDCNVPRGLRFYQWVDYFGGKKDASYKALISSLKLRYEQKLTAEKEEKLRKEKQEREAAEKAARDRAEKEAEEKRRIAREKAERKDAERKQKEKEQREISQRNTKADLAGKGIWESIKEINPVYWIVGFVVLGFSGVAVYASLNRPLQSPEETPVIAVTLTETVEPTETQEPTLIPTSTLSPTPLPTEITDAKGITMRLVSAGEFTMGSEVFDDEKHEHQVYLSNYYMDTYEVTNFAYKSCVEIGICAPPAYKESKSQPDYYDNPQFNNYPVVNVNWYQAKTYCEWRSTRLPTEAEWEKAARGTDGRIYPWGDIFDGAKLNSCDKNCVYDNADYAENDGYADIAPIGSYPNGIGPYGIYDMAGNVVEWVNDWYDSVYYPIAPFENPLGPNSGKYRVQRGGSYLLNAFDARSSKRSSFGPDFFTYDAGFRCAKSVTGDSPAIPVQTETPTFSETPTSRFEIIALPTVVYRGGDATITIRTQPGSACELGFILPSGDPSGAGGLGPRTADGEGICSWTWTIASNTGTGAGYATIIAGGASERYMIEIQ